MHELEGGIRFPSSISETLEEIELFRHAQVQLSLHLNQLLPINRLPSDVLYDIFRLFFTMCFYNVSDVTEMPSYENFLNITHVCHRWRDIALIHGSFWSFIHVNVHYRSIAIRPRPFPVQKVETLLERSQKVPLTIYIEVNAKCPPEGASVFRRLFNEIWRFKHLQIAVHSPHMNSMFNKVFSGIRNMPLLQTIKLHVYEGNEGPEINLPQSWLFPHLENISFLGDHSTSQLRPFVEGGLRSFHFTPTSPPDLLGIISLLNCMPKLEYLHIDMSECRSSSGEINKSDAPVSVGFPCLRKLTLRCKPLSTILLLKSLKFPQNIQLKLHLLSTGWNLEPLNLVLRRLPDLAAAISNRIHNKLRETRKYNSISIHELTSRNTQVVARSLDICSIPHFQNYMTHPDQGWFSELPTDFDLTIPFPTQLSMQQFYRDLGITGHIELLEVRSSLRARKSSVDDHQRDWMWTGILPLLPQLKVLIVSCDGDLQVQDIFEILEGLETQPRLETLVVREANLEDRTADDETDIPEKMQSVLIGRERRGYPLRTLILTDCVGVTEEMLDLFRPHLTKECLLLNPPPVSYPDIDIEFIS